MKPSERIRSRIDEVTTAIKASEALRAEAVADAHSDVSGASKRLEKCREDLNAKNAELHDLQAALPVAIAREAAEEERRKRQQRDETLRLMEKAAMVRIDCADRLDKAFSEVVTSINGFTSACKRIRDLAAQADGVRASDMTERFSAPRALFERHWLGVSGWRNLGDWIGQWPLEYSSSDVAARALTCAESYKKFSEVEAKMIEEYVEHNLSKDVK